MTTHLTDDFLSNPNGIHKEDRYMKVSIDENKMLIECTLYNIYFLVWARNRCLLSFKIYFNT